MPRAYAPQHEKPPQWEAHAPQQRVAPTRHNQRKPTLSNEDPTQPKINKSDKKCLWLEAISPPSFQMIHSSVINRATVMIRLKYKSHHVPCLLPNYSPASLLIQSKSQVGFGPRGTRRSFPYTDSSALIPCPVPLLRSPSCSFLSRGSRVRASAFLLPLSCSPRFQGLISFRSCSFQRNLPWPLCLQLPSSRPPHLQPLPSCPALFFSPSLILHRYDTSYILLSPARM